MFKNSFNTWDDDPIIELVMSVSCICFYTQLVSDVDGNGVMFFRHVIQFLWYIWDDNPN